MPFEVIGVLEGLGGPWLVGLEGETWDRSLLVRYPSAEAFLSLASDAEYLIGAGHRVAALADSRLLV